MCVHRAPLAFGGQDNSLVSTNIPTTAGHSAPAPAPCIATAPQVHPKCSLVSLSRGQDSRGSGHPTALGGSSPSGQLITPYPPSTLSPTLIPSRQPATADHDAGHCAARGATQSQPVRPSAGVDGAASRAQCQPRSGGSSAERGLHLTHAGRGRQSQIRMAHCAAEPSLPTSRTSLCAATRLPEAGSAPSDV